MSMSSVIVQLCTRVRPCGGDDIVAQSITNSAAMSLASDVFVDSNVRKSTWFPPDTTQEEVYDGISANSKWSRHGVVLAYGATGSGKTYTIFGPPAVLTEAELSRSQGVSPSWGLLPRYCMQLLTENSRNSRIFVTVVEVYMDKVYDLLNDRAQVSVPGVTCIKSSANRVMGHLSRAQYDSDGKWVMPGDVFNRSHESSSLSSVIEYDITCPVDVVMLCRRIECSRTTRGHDLNARSSRSHCIITVVYECIVNSKLKTSQQVFVDLAGSERVSKSGVLSDTSGGARSIHLRGNHDVPLGASRLDEARNVNVSLTCLGRVISALSQRSGHVPYRDSVLTMVLRSVLTSCRRISIILTLSDEFSQDMENRSTLRFGRAVSAIGQRGLNADSTSGSGSSVSGIALTVSAKIVYLRSEISHLEIQQGDLMPSVPQHIKQSYEHNMRHLELAKLQVQALKERLSELISDGRDTSSVKHELDVAQQSVAVYFGMVARQQSTGLFRAPSAALTAKRDELGALEKQLAFLNRNHAL